jgi:pullulanase/glycogen debranching enzyme
VRSSNSNVTAGAPYPPGTTWDGRDTNFALFSALSGRAGRREKRRIAMPERSEDVWYVYLADVGPGQLYGYRVHGPYKPNAGHRFNPHKLLINPTASGSPGISPGPMRILLTAPATSWKASPSTGATIRPTCTSPVVADVAHT